MGSQTAPDVFFKAISKFLSNFNYAINFLIIGSEEATQIFRNIPQVQIQITSCEILPEESSSVFILDKRDSSLAVGVKLLRQGKIDALISTANSAAMVIAAKVFLEQTSSVERPPFIVSLPVRESHVTVLDVGANSDSTPEMLLQFAKLGVDFHSYCYPEPIRPLKIALLNIGEEAKKGSTLHKQAYNLLSQSYCSEDIQFIGNIEPDQIWFKPIDVLVTDGFTGNIFLKAVEGMVHFFRRQIPSEEIFDHIEEFDSGAILGGVSGLLMKCHGNSRVSSLEGAIRKSYHLIKNGYKPKPL